MLENGEKIEGLHNVLSIVGARNHQPATFQQPPTFHQLFHKMATRCSSTDSSKLTVILGQIQQYRSMLSATEKAAERKLFASHIYEEDRTILQAKIAMRVKAAQSLIRQCHSK